MRVLHLIDTLAVGGAETLVVESLNRLAVSHPQDRHYLATLFDAGPLTANLRDAGRYLHLGFETGRALGLVRRLRAFIRENQIQIVHSHLYRSTVFARLAIPKGVRLVSTYHTGFHNPASIEFSRRNLLIDRLTYRKGHHLIFVSQAVEKDIKMGLPVNGHGTVVKNFITTNFRPSYHYNQDRSLRLVSVGNLRDQKNHFLALDALGALKGEPVSLDIYGSGPLRVALQDRIDREQLPVRLLTDVRVTSEILANYDAFLMTSRHEGMPLALMEAMCTGLPSILNEIPYLRETAGEAALYFEKDSAAGLVSVLRRCLKDKAQLQRLAERTRLSQDWTIDRYVDKLRTIYERVLTA